MLGTYRLVSPLALIIVLTPLLAGCIYSREIAHTRRTIEREIAGADFERTFVLSLGPGSVRLARWITRLVDDPDTQNASYYLRSVRRIKVGVYRTKSLPTISGSRVPARIRNVLSGGEWELLTQFVEPDQLVWVFYRERYGDVRDLFVIVLDTEQMVIARVKGRLNDVVESVLEDYPPDDWMRMSVAEY